MIIEYNEKYPEEVKTYDFGAPKRGMVSELIVKKGIRNKGIGTKLLAYMEDYFKSINCKYVLIDVFVPNKEALEFYYALGYKDRMVEVGKRI